MLTLLPHGQLFLFWFPFSCEQPFARACLFSTFDPLFNGYEYCVNGNLGYI
jgi:hypothetical protein